MNSSVWHYRAYGLHWSCDFELPEFLSWPGDATDAPDVTVVTGDTLLVAEVERTVISQPLKQWEAQSARLFLGVARFTVSRGEHIVVEPLEGYGPSSWRVPLLGVVLAALLEQRGLFALHAGALVFPGGAAAFLGTKGQGKSTLNATLSRAGFPLLNDDVMALQMPRSAAQAPLALCGFSQIKLTPEAVRAVTQTEATDWPLVAPELLEIAQLDKRAFQAPLAQQDAPLRALFILHSADSPPANAQPPAPARQKNAEGAEVQEHGLRLRRLSAQEALAQLIPHTIGGRFGEAYLQGERRKTHFLNCARLVNSCAIWELTRPRDLALLPATAELIARVMASGG